MPILDTPFILSLKKQAEKNFRVINIYPDDLNNLYLKLGFLTENQKQVIAFQS
jgi:hypothetical protein